MPYSDAHTPRSRRSWGCRRALGLAGLGLAALLLVLPASAVTPVPAPAEAGSTTAEVGSTTAPRGQPEVVDPKNEIFLGFGPKVVFRKDQIKSPRLYSGPGLMSFLAGFRRNNEHDAHRVRLGFLTSTVRSQKDFNYLSWPDQESRTTEGDPLTSVRLSYAYLRNIPLRQDLVLRVGPALDMDLQQATYVYSAYGVDGHYGVFALDAFAEANYKHSDHHRFSAQLGLPLFAWVARSPYALNDDEQTAMNLEHNALKTLFRYIADGQFRTWNQVQAVRLAVRYDYVLSPRWGFSAEGEARILSVTKPRPLMTQDYGINFAVSYRF